MGKRNYSPGESTVLRNFVMAKAATVILATRDQTHCLVLGTASRQ
jgi:hypothetical protein